MRIEIFNGAPFFDEGQIFRIGGILMQVIEHASHLCAGWHGKAQQVLASLLQPSWLRSKVCDDSDPRREFTTTLGLSGRNTVPCGISRYLAQFPSGGGQMDGYVGHPCKLHGTSSPHPNSGNAVLAVQLQTVMTLLPGR